MSSFGAGNDLQALTNMLASAEEAAEDRGMSGMSGNSSSSSSSGSSSGMSIVTPGSIIASRHVQPKKALTNEKEKTESDPNAIWDAEDVDNHDPDFDDDGRIIPDYDILYKQKVASEDIYLGMSGKTPMTSDCNYMVLRIKMPGAELKNIDLKVEKQKIVVHDPTYRLATYLPYVAKDKEGKAQWLAEKDILSVTLPIDRGDGF